MASKRHYIIDGHIHIYPNYNLRQAILTGVKNLKKTTNSKNPIVPMWLLVERYDCNFFKEAADSAPIDFDQSDLVLKRGTEPETLIVEENEVPILYILAGRQVVTTENLEVLSLATDHFIQDRTLPARGVVESINNANGIAAINWAPGKWFFSRGKVVEQLLNDFQPTELFIGDTSLRPTMWTTPTLMENARQRGFKTIAGSDPLPFDNEEKQIGLYCFHVEGEFDESFPAKSLRTLIHKPDTNVHVAGHRNSTFVFARRQFKIMTEKR
ncbi:hypothetical protein JW960_11415 [candidate division KSB1 bacterium]|nr:hypothetical protein [candidate division KSB1 bacterium]